MLITFRLVVKCYKLTAFFITDSFDSPNVCHTSSVQNVKTRWLTDNEVVIINAKSDVDNDELFQECVIKFGPSSDSSKKCVELKIESFYINDCGVFLAVQQSPTAFFNDHVSTLVSTDISDKCCLYKIILTCNIQGVN